MTTSSTTPAHRRHLTAGVRGVTGRSNVTSCQTAQSITVTSPTLMRYERYSAIKVVHLIRLTSYYYYLVTAGTSLKCNGMA
jgi:hypothetical protein